MHPPEESRTVLADGSKLGETSPAVVLPADAIDVLVTDESAPEAELEKLRQVIPRVVVA